jgi:hypothetical protein
MVKLTPDQQIELVRAQPAAFMPENGAWGRQGCTAVRLDSVDEETLGEALTLAHQNIIRATAARKPKTRAKKLPRSRG